MTDPAYANTRRISDTTWVFILGGAIVAGFVAMMVAFVLHFALMPHYTTHPVVENKRVTLSVDDADGFRYHIHQIRVKDHAGHNRWVTVSREEYAKLHEGSRYELYETGDSVR